MRASLEIISYRTNLFRRLRESTWLAYILALAGGVLYFIQGWVYTHIQTSFLDEGGYLYLGDLFIKGVIRPYQDYGPMRLYTPLAYLIPGQVEAWFGANLLTGRLLSFIAGVLMIIGLWITIRRWGGNWWAVIVVWAIAFTPISIQIYTLAISESLIACLLVFIMLLVLGKSRPLGQVIAGSILAGLMVITRQNMLPLIPLLMVYIFWQHGRKAGLWSIAGSLMPLLIVHVIYWPNILSLWASWLPSWLTPFLDAYRFPPAGSGSIARFSFSTYLLAFELGFRYHYFTMVGFLDCLFFWPSRAAWKSEEHRRAAIFLAVLFGVLALVHELATIAATDPAIKCVFCFTPYLAFFDVLVFLLVAISFPSWKRNFSMGREMLLILAILLLSAGLGYSVYDRFGPWLLNTRFPAFNRGLNPAQWTPFITLWDILSNKYHLEYWSSRVPISTLAGLIIGILAVGIGWLVYRVLQKGRNPRSVSFGLITGITLLALGFVVSPLMGGSYRDNGICRADIPSVYKQIGATLTRVIPPDAQVYWAFDHVTPLLYASTVHIPYAQVYGTFTVRQGGNNEQNLKQGFWNLELANQWLSDDPFIVAGSQWNQRPDYPGEMVLSHYTVTQTVPTNPCVPSSYLLIYSKKP